MASRCKEKIFHILFEPSKSLIALISIGKHNSGLYHHKNRGQSSVMGGIISLISIIGIAWYSITSMYQILNRQSYVLEDSQSVLNSTRYTDISLESFETQIFRKKFSVFVESMDQGVIPDCSDIQMRVSIVNATTEYKKILDFVEPNDKEIEGPECQVSLDSNPQYIEWLSNLHNISSFDIRTKFDYLRWGYYQLYYEVLVKDDRRTKVKHMLLFYDTYTISQDGGKSAKRLQYVIRSVNDLMKVFKLEIRLLDY